MTDTNPVMSSTVSFLKSKGFVYNTNKYKHAIEPNGLYSHPIGVHVEVWDKRWTDRVEVTFEGPTIERPRTIKYAIDNLNALFNRTQRILLAAMKDNARRKKEDDARLAKRNKLVDAVREFGVVTLLPREFDSYAVRIEYLGYRANVHMARGEPAVLIDIGTSEFVSLDVWTKIVDAVQSKRAS